MSIWGNGNSRGIYKSELRKCVVEGEITQKNYSLTPYLDYNMSGILSLNINSILEAENTQAMFTERH